MYIHDAGKHNVRRAANVSRSLKGHFMDTSTGLEQRKNYLKLVAAIVDGLRLEAGPMVDAEAISMFRILSHKLRNTAVVRG
jgi:hypothetical protein